MPYSHHTRFENMYPAILAFCAGLFFAGIMMDSPQNILEGLKTIIWSEDGLITDYIYIAGPGAALVNAAIVTFISAKILHWSKEPLNGFTMVVIGLMSGFSLFGKNFVNILKFHI